MDTIKSIIKVTSDILHVIKFVKSEVDANNILGEFFTKDILLYKNSIDEINKVATTFDDLNCSKLLEHRTVDFLIMTHIHNELQPHVEFFRFVLEWYNRNRCCYIAYCACSSSNRATNITKKMSKRLRAVRQQLESMNTLKNKVFGSGSRIDHPVFRQAWLLVGENQLNDSTIHENILSDNFYQLIKNIAGDDDNDKKEWKRKIYLLLKQIEGETISDKDSYISIIELNNLTHKFHRCKTVLDLLEKIESGEDGSPDINPDDIKIDLGALTLAHAPAKKKEEKIETSFQDRVEIEHSTSNQTLDNCEGYGSDFPATEVCEFTIPDGCNKILCAELHIEACDQGWGGTGHVQIRYRVDRGVHEQAFNVNRNNTPDNQYSFNIKGTEIAPGNKVKVFLLCPRWGGWSASVSKVDVKLKYK